MNLKDMHAEVGKLKDEIADIDEWGYSDDGPVIRQFAWITHPDS